MQRHVAAGALKRLHWLERAITLASAGWIPSVAGLETKAALARACWQDALAADAARRRVFELKYPDRGLERGEDEPLIRLFEALGHAPSPIAFLTSLHDVALPALERGYRAYLAAADETADGPSWRFIDAALRDKREQAERLGDALALERSLGTPGDHAGEWTAALAGHFDDLGGVGVGPPADRPVPEVVEPGRRFVLADDPARDSRYFLHSCYWPDNFDPGFPYGHGRQLQLRSAVSHLNEVWAVEMAGAILSGLAVELPWEFVTDAARWCYDEGRHMTMGRRRLARWGFAPGELPLGSYLYESCRGEDPAQRLAMLAYFETKNIGKKRDRAAEFHTLGDDASERDMEFDWADEGMHAGYGRHWMPALLEARGRARGDWRELVERCGGLVARRVEQTTEAERARLTAHVERLLATAAERIT